MATLDQLRSIFGGQTDEETIYAASQKLRISPTEIADEVGFRVGGKWGNRASASIDSYQANLYGLGEAMGSEWAGRQRRSNEAAAGLSREFAREQGAISSYKDIKGLGDAADYVGGLAVDSAPYLGEALVGGLAARGLMTGTRAGLSVARELGMPGSVSAANTALGRGSVAGAVAASYPSAVGDILSNQREENGTVDLGAAAALGVPYAALNAFGLEGAAARGQAFRSGVKALDELKGIRGGLARAGATAAGTSLQEGMSEVGQEFLNQAGRNAVNPSAGYFGPQALDRYAESFIGGAALGGVMGGVGGGWRRSEGYKAPVSADPGSTTDLLNTQPPAALGWNGYHQQGEGQAPFVVFPDGSTTTQSDAELLHRYGMTPDQLAGLRTPGPRVDPTMATADMSPYLPGKMVADEAGAVALDAPGAESLHGEEAGDPGLALARQRYLEQVRAAEQRKQTTANVAALAEERTALAKRTQETTGVTGTRAMDLFADLERQRDAGVLSQSDFESDASLISTREYGKVARNIKTRDAAAQEKANAANAAGTGQPGPADAGGSQRGGPAPGQPGVVQPAAAQPAAQVVPGAVAPAVATADDGGNAPLRVLGAGASPELHVRAAEAVGREPSDKERAVLDRLANASPRDQGIFRDVLGWDADNHQTREPMAYEAVGAKYLNESGPNKGKPMDRKAIQKVLGKMGVSEKVADAIRASYTESTAADELTDGGVLDGYREGTAAEVSGQARIESEGQTIEDSAAGKALKRRAKEAASTSAAVAQVNEEEKAAARRVSADTTPPRVTPESRVAAAEAALRAAQEEEAAHRAEFQRLVDAVPGVTREEVESAGREFDDAAEATAGADKDGTPLPPVYFNALDFDLRVQVVKLYRTMKAGKVDMATVDRAQGYLNDEQRARTARRGARDYEAARDRGVRLGALAGERDAASDAHGRLEGATDDGGRGQGIRALAAPEERDEDVVWGDGTAQMSRDSGRSGDEMYHTAETLEDSLLSFMNVDALGKRVVIVDSAADLKAADDILAGFDTSAVAWARNGLAFLIADRIPVGKERGVFLHEVGGHLGLERLLGEKEFDRLVGKILAWSGRTDSSPEARIARAARERVEQAGTEGAAERNAELVAYFLEEAVNAGVNPTAMKFDTEMHRWMRSLWAAFKIALRKLGVNIDKLTAQDVVDVAYGAARLNVTGRFHGTAANVQQFRTKYIGTGEGAQAYGWGLYFSELRGVAEGYKKADVQRKSRGVDGQPGQRDMTKWHRWGELKRQARDEDFLGFENTGQLLNAYRNDRRAGADFTASYDVSPILLNLLKEAVDYFDAPARVVKGNLYATDIAVKPDEFLDWTKPLDEQPTRIRSLLANNEALREYVRQLPETGHPSTGGGLYHLLEDRAKALAADLPGSVFEDRDDVGAPEVASRWLDSIGIKGVRMPVNYTRGGTYDEGRNFVVFNEKNVIKAMDNPANRVSKSIQFSKAPSAASAAVERLNQARQQIHDRLPPQTQDNLSRVTEAMRRAGAYVLSNFQLGEVYGDRIKELPQHLKLTDLMVQESTRQQMAYDAVAQRWNALPKTALARLNDLALKATLAEAHPDLEFTDKANAHLKPEMKAEHARLAQAYQQLARTWPEAARIYQDAKKTLDESWDAMQKAIEALHAEYGKKLPELKKTPGPYFPLMRFGDYLAIGESRAFLDLQDELQRAAPGSEERKKIQERLDEMKRDEAHYIVSAHETRAAMERAAASYGAQGLQARQGMADQRLEALPKDVHTTVSTMAREIAKQFDSDTTKEITDALAQMLLRTLPEAHALERQAKRRGVTGASPDMLHAFAAAGRQNAFYTARLQYAKPLAANMRAMKDSVKGDVDLMHIHRELEKRVALSLQYKDTPIQNAVNAVSWAYHLGVSPTFLAMNMAQPWLVSGPVLAGKYGLAKATAALGRASREAFGALKDARFKDGRWSPWEGITENSIETTRKNADGVSEDRKALRELLLRGIVDEGLVHDMGTFAEGGSSLLGRVSRTMGWAAQQIELTNRMSTALATFRLARDSGLDYQAAVDEAYKVTAGTQVDYSAEGAPRFMREGGGIPLAKMLFQFRRYQQAMLFLLSRNVKQAFSSGEDARVARSTLGYFAITNAMVGGVLGLPAAGAAMALAGLFRHDDDEEGDVRTQLRNFLVDMTGDRKTAELLAKGIPAYFGADLSSRLAMGDVASLYQRLNFQGAKTAEDKVGRILTNVLGPSAGLAAQAFNAGAYFEQGDWAKGTEQLVPKTAADVLKAVRYGREGMTDRKGEEILGATEIGAWDKVLRALGTTSTTEANYYEGTAARKNLEQAISDRKARIHNQYRAAVRSGEFDDVREAIAAFNEEHPMARIKPKDEVAWRQEAIKAQRQRDETGIKFDPRRDQKYAEVMRFAR